MSVNSAWFTACVRFPVRFSGAGEHMDDMGHIAKTDAELVEASRRGEHEAFGQLVSRYQDVVCAVSYSSTGDRALSEDVAQETFIAAWRQLDQLRETGRLRSWLCGIARNLARKARQRTRSRAARRRRLAGARRASPFDATAQAEVDRVVRDALARVPETYREVLVLYYRENRSVREVAAALGDHRGRGDAAADARPAVSRRRRDRARRAFAARCARPRKSLVAACSRRCRVAVPSRVDASPDPEGSTMLKLATRRAAVVAVGTTATVVVTSTRRATTAARRVAADARSRSPRPHAPTADPRAPRRAATPRAVRRPRRPGAVEDGRCIPSVDRQARRSRSSSSSKGPSRGPANAPVTIVVFQDLMCQYCGKVLGTIDRAVGRVSRQAAARREAVPGARGRRELAAEASLAADAQGKFWELHDLMIAHQDDLSRDAIVAYGQQAGLDVAQARRSALDQHIAIASALDSGGRRASRNRRRRRRRRS